MGTTKHGPANGGRLRSRRVTRRPRTAPTAPARRARVRATVPGRGEARLRVAAACGARFRAAHSSRPRAAADTPSTRKVLLRSAMVMGAAPGGPFDLLARLCACGLGGSLAGGAQYISWIHELDFVRAVTFLLERRDLSGPFNLASPDPLPQRDFMAALRAASGTRLALPATKWMLEVGSFFLRTETELILKSRRVVPTRLLDAGFRFEFPAWNGAAREIVARRAAA